MVLSGFIRIINSDIFTFRINGDDGVRLLIDGKVAVEDDGLHGPRDKDGSIQLTAGDHAIRIEYFERSGGNSLSVQYKNEIKRELGFYIF